METESYTDDRKNNAIWDTGNGKVADDALHGIAGKQWKNATELEKDKVYEYTYHYSCTNEPLQGRHYYDSKTKDKFLERVNNITSYINKNERPCDMWFMRGDDSLSAITSRINKVFKSGKPWVKNASRHEKSDYDCEIMTFKSGKVQSFVPVKAC